ncbi:olfactory receptor 6B1-like [Calonectris borealis]|uniref:olfactory receptor 6B1-like n=1 Tax=Calonectris borealis TaxID=1323832 RepID=UPI003F4BBF55
MAICNPLHYPVIMDHRVCMQLAMGSWLVGFLTSVLKVFFIFQLSSCGPNVINHFYCDISPLLNLSCTERLVAEMVDFVFALLFLLISLSLIVISYMCIISIILCIPMARNRKKTYSTCVSLLTVVIIFFSATLFMYARSRSWWHPRTPWISTN